MISVQSETASNMLYGKFLLRVFVKTTMIIFGAPN